MQTATIRKITEFDRTIAGTLGKQARTLLEPLAQQHGLTIKDRGGRYDSTMLKLTFELLVTETPDGKSGDQAQFEKYCFIAGLTPDQFGLEFTYSGETYRIVGIAPKRSKRPVIGARTTDGKRFVFPPEVIRQSA